MPPPRIITLGTEAGLQISVMDLGSSWVSCQVRMPTGELRRLILDHEDPANFLYQPLFVGATIGRYANRIRNARFVIHGKTHRLDANEGAHHLHGGSGGFDQRIWKTEAVTDHSALFSLCSPDGDQGYPGVMNAQVRYSVGADCSVRIDWQAQCTQACPVSLTNHAYFNLDGEAGVRQGGVLDHRLRIQADHWLPVDDANLPSPKAKLSSVQDLPYDFRVGKRLRDAPRLDHAFALSAPSCTGQESTFAAELTSSDERVRMTLVTDQPALQIYTGQGLNPAHAGVAIEPQHLPDSPNQAVCLPHWPSCILHPGDTWRRSMLCKFELQ